VEAEAETIMGRLARGDKPPEATKAEA
jgi:hypothetical protein